jgi:3'-phosphoadenosine 5'-phosphosulfate sulfotransferase (PAPS reductase)/FAD synthetase
MSQPLDIEAANDALRYATPRTIVEWAAQRGRCAVLCTGGLFSASVVHAVSRSAVTDNNPIPLIAIDTPFVAPTWERNLAAIAAPTAVQLVRVGGPEHAPDGGEWRIPHGGSEPEAARAIVAALVYDPLRHALDEWGAQCMIADYRDDDRRHCSAPGVVAWDETLHLLRVNPFYWWSHEEAYEYASTFSLPLCRDSFDLVHHVMGHSV